jgi:putative flippase GtrA
MNSANNDGQSAEGWLQRRFSKLRGKPMRFLVAGGLNTVVGTSAYPLLLWLSPWFREHYLVALAVVQAFCLCFAFTTYKFGVFRTRDTNVFNEFWKFSSYYVINYAANWIVLPLLVEVGKFDPLWAQIGFGLTVLIGSWFWHSQISFSSKAAKPR